MADQVKDSLGRIIAENTNVLREMLTSIKLNKAEPFHKDVEEKHKNIDKIKSILSKLGDDFEDYAKDTKKLLEELVQNQTKREDCCDKIAEAIKGLGVAQQSLRNPAHDVNRLSKPISITPTDLVINEVNAINGQNVGEAVARVAIELSPGRPPVKSSTLDTPLELPLLP